MLQVVDYQGLTAAPVGGFHKSLTIKDLRNFLHNKKPLPLAGRGIFAAIFDNIWLIMRPCLVDLIWPTNNRDVCEVDGMRNHFLPSSHELLIDNLIP